MTITFEVTGISLISDEAVKIDLIAEATTGNWRSDITLRIPEELLPLYYLGRQVHVDLPDLLPSLKTDAENAVDEACV